MTSLNTLIARARGYYVKNINPGMPGHEMWCMYAPDGTRHWLFKRHQLWSNITENDAWDKQPPCFDSDANDAWPLLTELPNGGITASEVSWFEDDGFDIHTVYLKGKSVADAATAISEAWLIWKGIEYE